MQTPVDLHSYTAHLGNRPGGDTTVIAPPAQLSVQPRLTIARRPALELPLSAARSAAGAAGPEFEPVSGPGELELNLELDVPAFLRRSEG